MTHKEERRRSTDKLADIICACEVEKLKRALADSEEHNNKLTCLLARASSFVIDVASSADDYKLIEEIDAILPDDF